jgi:hypothetical protein
MQQMQELWGFAVAVIMGNFLNPFENRIFNIYECPIVFEVNALLAIYCIRYTPSTEICYTDSKRPCILMIYLIP